MSYEICWLTIPEVAFRLVESWLHEWLTGRLLFEELGNGIAVDGARSNSRDLGGHHVVRS
jgi:hypothetical protein